jgi:RNA polymerase-binding transcription factor DksA
VRRRGGDRRGQQIADAEESIADLLRDWDGAGDDQADAGTKTFEREHEMSLANNARELLLQNERALARLADGTYGVCERCGKPIGKLRLQAFPGDPLRVVQAAEERRFKAIPAGRVRLSATALGHKRQTTSSRAAPRIGGPTPRPGRASNRRLVRIARIAAGGHPARPAHPSSLAVRYLEATTVEAARPLGSRRRSCATPGPPSAWASTPSWHPGRRRGRDVRTSRKSSQLGGALSGLLGGAVGNLIDGSSASPASCRSRRRLYAFPNFPVFNVADSSIVSAS